MKFSMWYPDDPHIFLLSSIKQTFMDYVMRRRSTVGGALEMFSLPLLSYVSTLPDITQKLKSHFVFLTLV